LVLVALTLAISLDGLAVGFAYGLRGVALRPVSYAVMAACTGILMACSMALGSALSAVIPGSLAHVLGGLVLVFIGLAQMVQSWRAHLAQTGDGESKGPVARFRIGLLGVVVEILRDPAAADINRSGVIDAGEAYALGLALGLDALGAGLGAALTGFSPLVIPLVAAACSGLVALGVLLGKSGLSATGAWRRGYLLPGMLLVLIGLVRLGRG